MNRGFPARRAAVAALAALPLLTASPAGAAPAPPGDEVRLLGEAIVPHRLDHRGTTVGGLSGIDRNPCTGEYVLISDDRSYLQPARFYTADFRVDEHGVGPVEFTGTAPFRQPDGTTYPAPTAHDGNAVDPEDVRVDPRTCQYWWAQEGNRPKTPTSPDPVIQPSALKTDDTGRHLGQHPLPPNYEITRDERGPRRNLVVEAITFDRTGSVLTSALEGPLLQDGPLPTTEHGALTRITGQTRTGEVLSQHAYPLEPVFAAPRPGGRADTGVPAVLAHPDDPTRFLVLERTYVDGAGFKVRLFEATTDGATDVQHVQSLQDRPVRPMHKRLLVDFDDLDLSTVDNLEGMTWGPRLPSGERTLVLVSDDGFHPQEVTQIIALALPGES
ncbi:esterase-like activity of phytase family protein [Saccharopolyspora hirsuta]|uniref:Esterase-like activity of phytase family protein n=1 Tax=Saccharopolyspora hirsuta TaxID=1837 RepID=A0A5M7BKJ6_SACHI|nr:esterase-like activity of phytase family protein [Saccharopolyspora hirsuta]KAA5830596.1 esterase-like activity of phytase family protein [Saccharopolyspora hirsuta]